MMYWHGLILALAAAPAALATTPNQGAGAPAASGPRLPAHMSGIELPHIFTPDEMDAIRGRLRAFSLELQTFSVIKSSLNQDQLQMNYAQGIWPLMQCLILNQDALLPSK